MFYEGKGESKNFDITIKDLSQNISYVLYLEKKTKDVTKFESTTLQVYIDVDSLP